MKRIWIVGLCLIVLVVCSSTWGVARQFSKQTEICIPMGDIEINPPASVKGKRSSVNFPHSMHFGYDCKKCHHTWKGNGSIVNCMTSGCHNIEESPTKTGKNIPAIRYYKTAYHNSCIGCHKEVKKNNQSKAASGVVLKDKLSGAGPTSCKGCHPAE